MSVPSTGGVIPPGRRHRRFLKSKRTWVVLVAAALGISIAVPAASFADLSGGCDFSPANNGTPSCLGPLPGSTFAGGDGNLLASPTTFGSTDWQNVSGLNHGVDKASGNSDNSFGQGTKEDDPNVTVVTGSIPNNKSDLTRFYEASEFSSVNNHNFLYLGWERANVLGTANMDFEINQNTTTGFNSSTTGPVTLNRTAGDLLVTFDFTNGGGRPTIALLRWLTSASVPVVPGFNTNSCFSANSFPCWGDRVALDGSDSIAAVNNLDAVTDPLFSTEGNYQNPVPALQFGETAIDLTKANVFPSGTCTAFGSAFVKSRASAAFTAEAKDFIAPIPVNISNCGEVKIIKNTDPRGLNQDFSYTSTIPNPPTGSTSPTCTADSTPSSFTLNDGSQTTPNTEDCTKVPVGSYTVTEGAEPANFSLESLTCSATGAGSSGSQDQANAFQANITLAPNGVVTCTYVNQAAGAILVTKTAKNHNLGSGQHPLAGATFAVNGVSKTTDANGQACFDGLAIGQAYTVTETSAPNGYSIDTTSKSVTPGSAANCTGVGTPTGVSFTDSPLTDISASATSEVPGATNSTITCKDANGNTVANSGALTDPASVSKTGLTPGTYTCTIVIDP
jgi:hypothetical protein